MPADGHASPPVLDKVSYGFTCSDGPDAVFHVHRVRLAERVSQPYQLELDLVTPDVEADAGLLLGGSAELTIGRGAHERSVYGIVTEVDYVGHWGSHLLVHVRVAPGFALLKQRVHSRIFQEMSVQEIVGEVLDPALGEYNRTFDPGASTRGSEPRDYCVQYHESDLDFVCRLLEEEGISYHFRHDTDAGHEVLTLADDNAQFADFENVDGSRLLPIVTTQPETADVESLRTLDWRRSLVPTSSLRRDYDFLAPMQPLSDSAGDADDRGRTRRLYHHMRRRYVLDDVSKRAEDRLEAAQQVQEVGRGQSNAVGMLPGIVFELDRHALADLEQAYLVTAALHTGAAPEEVLATADGAFDDGEVRYQNRIECIPLTRPLRPRQLTPKPRVHGPQTAIVVGPPGEEIHTDEHGRIKIQLHWEEEGQYNDTSSCWVRVSQSWAGPGWGAQFIPRIGMEVVVEFLEGNPDRPLVTGCVYNGANAVPFALPDHKTQSGLRTNSSIGEGFNMLRFEDAAGGEEIYLHAQKDWNTDVLNDRTTTIGNDETHHVTHDRDKTVDNNQSETIGVDKSIQVCGNHTETVDGNQTQTVGGNQSLTVHKDQSITVLANSSEKVVVNLDQTVGANRSSTIAVNDAELVGAGKTVNVGGVYAETVGGGRSMAVGGGFTLSAGAAGSITCAGALTISSSKNIETSAGEDVVTSSAKKMALSAGEDFALKGGKKATVDIKEALTIKCGKASISLKKNGDVVIKGKKLTFVGSGDVKIKGKKIAQN